jgi:ribosomal-protein-alanine N-acetyltransferase
MRVCYKGDIGEQERYDAKEPLMELNCGKGKVRSWHPNDVKSIVKHANNRKVWLNLRDRFPYPYTKADAKNWIRSSLATQPETNFAIDVFGEAVGGISFDLKTDVERYSAEVGYWLGEEFWGQGICTLVLKAATPYAIETYHLNRIFAVPFTQNLASIRVLEKAGYTRECTMRRSAFKDGRFVDEVLYAFVIEDWTPNESK